MEKKPENNQKKEQFTLTEEELRELTQAELDAVKGGGGAFYQGSD